MTSIVIGIDPDLVKSGVAVVNNGEIITLDALNLFELFEFIKEHKHLAHFVVEDVEHDQATYYRKGANGKVMQRISQNVGQVKAIGRVLGEYLVGCDAQFTLIKPLRGSIKKAKKDAEYFNKLTGWTGRSNEDKRDAALLALSYVGKFKK